MLQIWDSTPGYGDRPFGDTLWSALDEAIGLSDCDVYSYKSDGEDDPFGELCTLYDIHGTNDELSSLEASKCAAGNDCHLCSTTLPRRAQCLVPAPAVWRKGGTHGQCIAHRCEIPPAC